MSRRAGRMYEGTCLFMVVAVIAVVVGPYVGERDDSTAPGADCLAALAGLTVGAVSSDATCPASARGYAVTGTDGGVEALACPDPASHLGSGRPRFERRAPEDVWSFVQDLPAAPDLTVERGVATGAWLTRTTARRDAGALTLTTRPALLVRAVLAPLLALAALIIALLVVQQDLSGWRPGGPPPQPGKLGFAARVAVTTAINPLFLAAAALLALDARVEVTPGALALRPAVGSEVVITAPLAVAALPDGDDRRVVVVARGPDGAVRVEGVLTLEQADLGVARAIRDGIGGG